ncbi:GTPase domain-containing protein [Stomatohabitans albus]|uniref:GTPase domain-containing protein n=1 Tax=Stomatohabitans albus TaxID=3110766 RepID=UPI00300CD630
MSLVSALNELKHLLKSVNQGVNIVDQIDDYLIPRLNRLDAPLLAVLGGSTGAGKSTITNSLIGQVVSEAGVLRPTTRSPLLLCNPDDQAWFTAGGVLPELPRSTGARGTGIGLRIVPLAAIPAGLGLIDAPDVDSFEVANHELAAQLLRAADLWLFTTTAARYADAVPWGFLDQAAQHGVAIAVIINRIPPGEAVEVVVEDFERLLHDHGLGHVTVFAIEEHGLHDGLITDGVEELKTWMWNLVADEQTRRQTIGTTLNGVLESLPARVEEVAAHLDRQADARDRLETIARNEFEHAADSVMLQAGRGVALKTEVIDRFVEHVGTSGWMDQLQRTAGRWRDKLVSLFTREDTPEDLAAQEIEGGLSLIVTQTLLDAQDRVQSTWAVDEHAPTLPPIDSDDLSGRVDAMVAQWRSDLLAMVRQEAQGKVGVARGLSIGVNAIGVALMLAVFSYTGGITGGEVAVAGGTAAIGQAMLSAVFGDQAVRSLVKAAAEDLKTRVYALANSQGQVAVDALADLPTHDDSARLRALVEQVAVEHHRELPRGGNTA